MFNPGDNLVCKSCQLTFSTDVDFDLHACLEIKQETQDCDQELSEEFLSTIIQYVDDLCNIIRNGDSNLKRTIEVNKNLNKAVSCYRNELNTLDLKDKEYHIDHAINVDSDNNSDNGLEDAVEFKSKDFVGNCFKSEVEINPEVCSIEKEQTKGGKIELNSESFKDQKGDFEHGVEIGSNYSFSENEQEKTAESKIEVFGEYRNENLVEKPEMVGGKRKIRCKECTGCLAKKCNKCNFCRHPHLKRPCINRNCNRILKVNSKSNDLSHTKIHKGNIEHEMKTRPNNIYSENRLEDTVEFKSGEFVEKDVISKAESDQDEFNKKETHLRDNDTNIDNSMLFPYLRYNQEKPNFVCSLCNKAGKSITLRKQREYVLGHIKLRHKSEINFKAKGNNSKIFDCETKNCKIFYSKKYKHLWCTQCTVFSQIPKLQKKKRKPKNLSEENKEVSKSELCSECGINVKNLILHQTRVHNKSICPHCSLEVNQVKVHIRNVHEKVSCMHCGKLIPVGKMNVHIESRHTSNEDKKFKCDICSKGFINITRLKEHQNIHTGKKPFKCKFCASCFANRGTRGTHQRSHLGHRRDYSNK